MSDDSKSVNATVYSQLQPRLARVAGVESVARGCGFSVESQVKKASPGADGRKSSCLVHLASFVFIQTPIMSQVLQCAHTFYKRVKLGL